MDWTTEDSPMKKFLFAVAAAVAILAFAGSAQAQAPNPFGSQGQQPIFKSLFHKQPLPAFQAAPWYLYWPYNAHFQTPAPMMSAPYYAPPGVGNAGYQLNPYFPQQPYGAFPVK
jgi:opacity protein-like surface antigen